MVENKSNIEIFQADDKFEIKAKFENDTVWLNQVQMATLFEQTKQNISLHINHCFKEGELLKKATVKDSLTVQKEGKRTVKRKIDYYNLDVIISVGYRVKSQNGTKFRQWATQRLKDYLVQGYAINEKRLKEKQQEVEHLKTGIRILNRAIEQNPSLEEKAATLLYLITKNHSFIDGNKRIAAASFLLFLKQNNGLYINNKPIISNDALATLTLFIANSKADESDTVKRLVVSVLNRNKP